MRKCKVTKQSVSGGETVANQPGTSKTVLLRTNTVSSEATDEGENKIYRKSGKSEEITSMRKQAIGKNKSNDMRGMRKCKWSREERLVLWECYVRSKITAPSGYIKALADLWETNGCGERSQASLLSQVKSIQNGSLLSEFERRVIEKRVQGSVSIMMN